MRNGNKIETQWTPEQKNQQFKEIITGILGVLIVASTLILAFFTFLYVGEPAKIADAKDILQVLLGIAGVVIGYYFGRVPAEAHAVQAREQANEATAKSEQISAQAQGLSDQVDQVMDRMATGSGATRGISPQTQGTQVIDDLQKIRDDLRALSSSGRRRI
jgi:uncharacterized membrane protein